MYSKIMVPVDLARRGKLEKAQKTVADISKLFGGFTYLAGTTTAAPDAVARKPRAFAQRLKAPSSEQSCKSGLLIVMASRLLGFRARILSSNTGCPASRSQVCTRVVR